jgi:hypothetical protein
MSPVTPSNSGEKKQPTTGNKKRKKHQSGISHFKEKRQRTPSKQNNATTNVAVPSTPDRERSSPKLLFFFDMEKSRKLPFERTAVDYKLSPKLLFQKEIGPTKYEATFSK